MYHIRSKYINNPAKYDILENAADKNGHLESLAFIMPTTLLGIVTRLVRNVS